MSIGSFKEKSKCLFGFFLVTTIVLILVLRHQPFYGYTNRLAEFHLRQQETHSIYELPAEIKANMSELVKELEGRLKMATERKVIIIWYPPFGAAPQHSVDPENCGNCEFTYDKSKISDNATRAVVIHFNEISSRTMPSATDRNPNQIHVFWTMEGPPALKHMRGRTLEHEDNYGFNATMSHRRDSDFLTSYVSNIDMKDYFVKDLNSSLENLLGLKSKLALALVSNCGATAGSIKRLQILKEIISLGFKLETHGACFHGNGDFPRGDDFINRLREYKFYFAFENSYHCRDYITEKVSHNAYGANAVPVVWGATRVDYEAVLPPNSFVYVEDFATSRDLIDYLNYLDKNDTAYLEYFSWYEMQRISDRNQIGLKRVDGFCHMCRALYGINFDDIFKSDYSRSNARRPIFTNGLFNWRSKSIRNWFYESDNPECLKTKL